MNTTRLDDKLNTFLTGAALALLVGLAIDVGQGSPFGRNDAPAGAMLIARKAAAPAPARAAEPVTVVAAAR